MKRLWRNQTGRMPIALTLLGLLLFTATVHAARRQQPEYHDARLKVGARPLPLTGGKDLAGKPFSVAGYKGTVLLIDFWATW